MKPFNRFPVMTILIATMALSSCKDDVYDPDKIRQIPPAENPFGENFKAPDGFDWSMNLSLKLNVEVKDEFAGQYDYLIEAFTLNPFYSTTATPIAAGYAKKSQNYTTEISLPKSISLLYIRVTDPKLRNAVYEYAVPENGGTLDCKLYYTATNTRAASSSGTSGWDRVSSQIKEYGKEQEQATDLSGMTENYEFETGTSDQLKNGSVYIIKKEETFSGKLTNYKQGATVIVKGIWNITSTLQGLDIYVANGGIITGTPLISDKCTLEIQDGGAVDCQSFTTQTNIPVKNFGTFRVTGTSRFNTGSSLYNAKNAEVAVQKLDLGQANITIVNFGTFQAESIDSFNSGVAYNAEGATFTLTGGIQATSSQVLNHGQMNVGGTIQTNSNLSTIIANYETGIFIADEFKGGGIFINDNYLELNTFDIANHTDAILYNNCTLIAKQLFKFSQAVIDHGSVTGPQNGDSWENVPVESYNEGSIAFKNGSIIKASTFKCGSNLKIDAKGDNPSMIQAEEITYSWTTQLAGNLLLDIDKEVNAGKQGQWGWDVQPQCNKSSTVKTTIPSGTAQESIETCSSIIYPGNGGSDTPETPELPEVGDNQSYTFAFEDQWPVYGDYDMNDVVLTIDKTKFTVKKKNRDEFVQEMKIEGRVKAVGASRTLGIGIQFLGLDNSVKTSELKQNGDFISFENGNDHPTLIVCEDVHRYMDSRQTDNTFINTEIGGKTDEAKNFNFSIKFDGQDVKPENLTIDKLDVFIYCKEGTHIPHRREIHLAGYAPTACADQSFSGASNDNGSRQFISNENLAWGIRIPSNEWIWPQEHIMIKDVYRDFEAWVTSGGTSGTDWWNSNNVNTSKLYHK